MSNSIYINETEAQIILNALVSRSRPAAFLQNSKFRNRMSYRMHVRLPELLEQNVLEPFVGNKLLSRIQDGHYIVGVFMLHP